MNYNIVKLEEKIIVGISAKTSNQDPNMGKIIYSLWDALFKQNIYGTIKNKINYNTIGLYSDYDEAGYCVTAGAQVEIAENPELTVRTIPAGNYAKFYIEGNMVTAVANAWEQIWQMDLERSFVGDFEEYLNDDFENAKINIFIALK